MFLITKFMFLLIKILPMLLLGLALFTSLLLRYFSDFLRLQSRSKFIIISLNVFLAFAVILTDNLWYVFYLIKTFAKTFGEKFNTLFFFFLAVTSTYTS